MTNSASNNFSCQGSRRTLLYAASNLVLLLLYLYLTIKTYASTRELDPIDALWLAPLAAFLGTGIAFSLINLSRHARGRCMLSAGWHAGLCCLILLVLPAFR